MDVTLRPGTVDDASACGTICYEAFKAIAHAHNFPEDFPSAEVAAGLLGGLLGHPGFYSLVAEVDGRIVGSNFLDLRSQIAGLGPITVDPATQNKSVGRQLMTAIMDHAATEGYPGVRLLQAAYHNRTLALYTRLGFEPREPMSNMIGPALNLTVPERSVRPATDSDAADCNNLCIQVHGHHRGGEVTDAIAQGSAKVVEYNGDITGYTTGIAYFAHSVGTCNDDIKALIGAAEEISPPGFLIPTRNGELLRWCLENGFRIVHPMTLMTTGLYNTPSGAYMTSVLY